MTPPSMKRFYREVSVVPVSNRFGLRLDQHQLSTPGKVPLLLPNAALAEAIADEWRVQGEKLAPATMPLSKLANTAIDRVELFRHDIEAQLLAFARSDVVCYRAGEPEDLVKRQQAIWDPVLAWLHATYGARLGVSQGIAFISQDEASIDLLRKPLVEADAFLLTALLNAAGILGSLVLAFAWNAGRLGVDAAFDAAHLEEMFQAERWGVDVEAAARREGKRIEMKVLERFLQLTNRV